MRNGRKYVEFIFGIINNPIIPAELVKQYKQEFRALLVDSAAMLYQYNTRNVDSRINWRADLAARFAEKAVDGKISVHNKGMDCDCASWYRVSNMDVPSVFAEQRALESAYEWADGPLHIWYDSPTEEYSESRDLALEAFEEGHAHVIYA